MIFPCKCEIYTEKHSSVCARNERKICSCKKFKKELNSRNHIKRQDVLMLRKSSYHLHDITLKKIFIQTQSLCSDCKTTTLVSQLEPMNRGIGLILHWNMPQPSGKKKSIDSITWSFSTFRNSADLLCLDLTNWSNPRSQHYNWLI